MSLILGIELIGLYVLWRLSILRRLIEQFNAVLIRTANGRAGSSQRIAASMVRVADYLELTRGSRFSPATFWVGFVIVGVIVSEVIAGDALNIALALILIVFVIGVVFAILVGNSLYNKAAQKNMARLLPEAFGIMGDEISAGHSVEAAVERVALQFGKPINQEFSDALIKMVASGGMITIDMALAEIAQNPLYESDSLDQAALTISVVRPLGGDLGELLSDLARLLHQREATEREIRTQLAPGRQAAWSLVFIIGALQLGLTMVPFFHDLLWVSYQGRAVLIGALLLIGGSVFWIMQINSQVV